MFINSYLDFFETFIVFWKHQFEYPQFDTGVVLTILYILYGPGNKTEIDVMIGF